MAGILRKNCISQLRNKVKAKDKQKTKNGLFIMKAKQNMIVHMDITRSPFVANAQKKAPWLCSPPPLFSIMPILCAPYDRP